MASLARTNTEENIANCNSTITGYGDLLQAEPGNMVGPDEKGMEDLIAKDPSAYWDTTNNKVVSSMHPSPRVVAIPLFDPVFYDTGKQNGRNADFKVGQLHGVLRRRDAGQGRQRTHHTDRRHSVRERRAAPIGAFPIAIVLVK